jgi:hypothetical protein
MKEQILNDKKVNPFSIIRSLPDRALFQDCPIKPEESTIEAAEEMYLRFCDPPTYVSSYDEQIIFEWYYPNMRTPKYVKELVFKDSTNMEWKDYHL